MSTTGPGSDRGSSAEDNASWPSSLSNSSLSRPDGDQPPNPWSREGSQPSEALGTPASAPSATPVPDPYQPSATSDAPYPIYDPPAAEAPPPGFDPQPTPPYGNGPASFGSAPPPPPAPYADPAAGYGTPPPYADPATPYGAPPPPYGDPAPTYGTPAPGYGTNPYDVAPYQPAYGASSPYGYGAVPLNHPQSNTAVIFGIVGIALAFFCVIGGFLGIPGIVIGRRVRAEIDAEPGRWGGRSQAQAGIVTGIVGLAVTGLYVAVLIIAVAAAAAAGEF